jgi:transcriptional repressor NrdR
MRCPVCGDLETRVIDSRVNKDGTEIRRRRACDTCSHRFTTYERPERSFPSVVKKDGRREAWDREKIVRGVSRACEKRPVSVEAIEELAEAIGAEVSAMGESEVSSRMVGERIMRRLKTLDEVAYVRFASVYRSFKDVDEFMVELAELIQGREPPPDAEAK